MNRFTRKNIWMVLFINIIILGGGGGYNEVSSSIYIWTISTNQKIPVYRFFCVCVIIAPNMMT